MSIHTLKKYLAYAQRELVEKIVCKYNDEHGPLVCNLDDDDHCYLYCLHCNYKIYPGYNTLNSLAKEVYRVDIERLLRK